MISGYIWDSTVFMISCIIARYDWTNSRSSIFLKVKYNSPDCNKHTNILNVKSTENANWGKKLGWYKWKSNKRRLQIQLDKIQRGHIVLNIRHTLGKLKICTTIRNLDWGTLFIFTFSRKIWHPLWITDKESEGNTINEEGSLWIENYGPSSLLNQDTMNCPRCCKTNICYQ